MDFSTHNQSVDFNDLASVFDEILTSSDHILHNKIQTAHYMKYYVSNIQGTTLEINFVKEGPIRFGEVTTNRIIPLDSLDNIGANIIDALYERRKVEDYIDLYWILTNTNYTFLNLYELAKKKEVDINDFYTADLLAEVENFDTTPVMFKPFSLEKMKSFFFDVSHQFLKKAGSE